MKRRVAVQISRDETKPDYVCLPNLMQRFFNDHMVHQLQFSVINIVDGLLFIVSDAHVSEIGGIEDELIDMSSSGNLFVKIYADYGDSIIEEDNRPLFTKEQLSQIKSSPNVLDAFSNERDKELLRKILEMSDKPRTEARFFERIPSIAFDIEIAE